MTSGHLHADCDGKVVNRIQQKKEKGGFYQEHAEFWVPTLLLDSDDIEASKGEVLSGAHKSSGLPFGLPMESRDWERGSLTSNSLSYDPVWFLEQEISKTCCGI